MIVEVILLQSRVKFNTPIPPRPDPTKATVGLWPPNQQRTAKLDKSGKAIKDLVSPNGTIYLKKGIIIEISHHIRAEIAKRKHQQDTAKIPSFVYVR
jgi:hypothetical protein